jgi:hypothetical protein
MAATPASLRAALPEFAAVTDNVVQTWLDQAATMMNPDFWGALYNNAHVFLAAHLMATMGVVTGVTASAGAVKSKTVGPVSITYESAGSTTEGDADLERTKYGRLYKAMRRTRPRSPMVL